MPYLPRCVQWSLYEVMMESLKLMAASIPMPTASWPSYLSAHISVEHHAVGRGILLGNPMTAIQA